MTADHGMTNWGSHGAGSDEEILTPFAAWGAGIRSDNHCFKNGNTFKSIKQIQIASLISSILGFSIPANNLGILPKDLLQTNDQNLMEILKGNFLQVLQQLQMKEKGSYQKYKRSSEEFEKLLLVSDSLDFEGKIQEMLDGLRFYHISSREILSFAVILGIILWIGSQILTISNTTASWPKRSFIAKMMLFSAVSIIFTFKLKLEFYQIIWLNFPTLTGTLLFGGFPLQSIKRMLIKIDWNKVFLVLIAAECFVGVFFERRLLSCFCLVVGKFRYEKTRKFNFIREAQIASCHLSQMRRVLILGLSRIS